jgi:hypothetical protein
VLALSDDPGPVNVERYLRASRALEDSRAPRQLPETRRRNSTARRRQAA